MNENEIVYRALEKLHQQTGLEGKWNLPKGDNDGVLDLYLPNNNVRHFIVEVKNEIRNHQLPKILDLATQHPNFMVVAERIFPVIKQLLREKNICYLDTAGNIYARTNEDFIWIDGNKVVEEKKTVTNRAFTKTGLRTVFYLLLYDGAINMPYRKLAAATGVALGNIKNIIEGLKTAGFILNVNDNTFKLQNKTALLERWITGYGETLKPTLSLGKYRFWKDEKLRNWETLPLQPAEGVWGGEPGGALLTNYLVPAHLTVYTEHKSTLVTRWTLIPDKEGDLEIYQKFWKDEKMQTEIFAPHLLVYADLVLTNDPRCIETAEMIYNKSLKNEFE
jgi:hypothetical protein